MGAAHNIEHDAIQHIGEATGNNDPNDPLLVVSTAVEQANDAILITNSELNPPGPQIVYANPAFTRMTGYTLDEVRGQTPRILHGPESDRSALDDVRQTLERGEHYAGEIINYRKDGSSYILQWHITPVRDGDGTITHWISVQRDVTEQKQIEAERLRLLEQAQAALQVRDELLTIVAHELRTPLTSLLGFTELLRKVRNTDTLHTAHVDRMTATVLKQAQRLNQLVEKMLDLEQIQHGQLALAQQPVDMAAVAEQVITEFEVLRAPNQTLQIEQPHMPLLVIGDELRLRHVIQQLVHNAILYSSQGGQILVSLAQEQDHVCVCVQDQGIGIPPDALPHIWNRFYRAPNVDPLQISGFGVGLYVVREIVQRHGGTITANSTQGRGSTFTVCLPRASSL